MRYPVGRISLRASSDPVIYSMHLRYDEERMHPIHSYDADTHRATLGFEPRVTLEQGFSELIEWAKTTPDVAEDFFDRALRELQDKGLLSIGAVAV